MCVQCRYMTTHSITTLVHARRAQDAMRPDGTIHRSLLDVACDDRGWCVRIDKVPAFRPASSLSYQHLGQCLTAAQLRHNEGMDCPTLRAFADRIAPPA